MYSKLREWDDDTMTTAILIVLVLTLGVLSFLAIRTKQGQNKNAEITQLKVEKAKLEADIVNERKTSEEKIKLLQDSEVRLKTEFENLANKIFEDKGKAISNENHQRISSLLDPFKTQLDSFRQRIDAVHTEDTKQSTELKEQVKQLQNLSNQVSSDANKLALAIKGDAKKQGDWGELIIERIFEASGLERGREYDVQTAMYTEDGRLQKPDFIVYLPGDKVVIIDSKVSLTAYERYCRVDEDKEKTEALSEHLKSVRNHVNELCSKDYTQLLGNRTLDFVVMCIPLEPAFQTALKIDNNLLYDIANTKIVITGPATLMITLKLIAQIWRREHENQNAEVIAEKAGRIYDQVRLIVESMTEAQKKLAGVTDSFDEALKRLYLGKGNLVGKVEEIRLLGAKVNKLLPNNIVEGSGVIEDQSPSS